MESIRFDRAIGAGLIGVDIVNGFYIFDGVIVLSGITVISQRNGHIVEISLQTIKNFL